MLAFLNSLQILSSRMFFFANRVYLLGFSIAIVLTFLAPPANAQIANFENADIGSPGASGIYTYQPAYPPGLYSYYYLSAAGVGVEGAADSFSFASTTVSGNIEIFAHVTSQQNTSNYAVGGLMIRESLEPGARHAFISVSPLNGVNFTCRTARNAPSTTTLGPSVAVPVWLKLVLSQDSLSGYQSSDGRNWTLVGKTKMVMPERFQAGLAVASNIHGVRSSVGYRSLSLLTNVPQRNNKMKLWLRSDIGVQYDGSSRVSKWQDQSVFGNDAVQETPSNQPVITSESIFNERPTVLFDGTDDSLRLPTSGPMNLTDGASVFVVTKATTLGTNKRILEFGTSGSNYFSLIEYTSGQPRLYVVNNGGADGLIGSTPLSTTAFQLVEVVQDSATNAALYRDSAPDGIALVNKFQSPNPTTKLIGRNFASTSTMFFAGNISEIIVFEGAVSAEQRHSLEVYFASKYSINCSIAGPVINPGCRVITGPQEVSIVPVPGTISYFTTDGTDPNTSSTRQLYTQPFVISTTTTVKSAAYAPGVGSANTVTTAFFQLDPHAAPIVGASPSLWLRADNGVIADGSGFVSDWLDISGNYLSASQTVAASQPQLQANQVNGLPAINFSVSGTADFMQLPAGFSNFTQGATIFVVTSPTSVSGSLHRRLLEFSNPASAAAFQLTHYAGSMWQLVYNNAGTSLTSASVPVSVGSFQLIDTTNNGNTSAVVYNNGVSGTPNNSMLPIINVQRNDNYIGRYSTGSYNYDGKVAEIILFSKALSDSQRVAIDNYLFARYGLKVNSPVISPATGIFGMTPVMVAITGDPGATLRYSLDGTIPNGSSTLFTAPFAITPGKATIVKAIAIQPFGSSTVSSTTLLADPAAISVPKTGQTLWLRSDSLVTKSGSSVSDWGSITGGTGAIQLTSGNQPQFVSNAVAGFPAIEFTSSNQRYFDLPNANLNAGATYFAVTKPGTIPGSTKQSVFSYRNATQTFAVELENNGNPKYRLNTVFGSGGTSGVNNVSPAGVAQLLEASIKTSNAGFLYQNGLSILQSVTSGFTNNSTGAALGRNAATSTQYLDGQIVEFLGYQRELSTAERILVRAYLMNRYGLGTPAAPTFSVPSGTTFFEPTQVAIDAPDGATIYYSITGPATTSSTVYTGPLTVSYSQTIYALAVQNGIEQSASATYTLDATKWPAPGAGDMVAPVINLQIPTQAQ